MADANGNGTARLWIAFGLIITVAVAWAGVSIKVHADHDRAIQDLYIRDAEHRRDVEANRERVAELRAQTWTNSTRISGVEQDVAGIHQYVFPGEQKSYKRRFRDNGEQIR